MMASVRNLAMQIPAPRLVLDVLAWRYGWIWMLSAALGVLGIVGSIVVRVPLEAQLLAASNERAAIAGEVERLSRRSASATPTHNLSVDGVLRKSSEIDLHVDAIYQTASRHQLRFTRSVLRTVDNSKTLISRTEITLPVRGTYPSIAEFIETLLREQPHLSVDQLKFRRENVSTAEGEAEIRISCWSRLEVAR
jgi:hypothetical protein